ncbi:hypothetical protein B0H21DRAFT_780625 [Amylocystis lapponica]|nr:hypothetical protein B0H21DRAFT_780625 [Amylocystis lapponica]
MATMHITWIIGAISTPRLQWGAVRRGQPHRCPYCHILLLTGEYAGFCCGSRGKYLQSVPPLPPLPDEFAAFIDDPKVSSLSRSLNLIFSFASLETTAEFPHLPGAPGFVAIQGKVYHRNAQMRTSFLTMPALLQKSLL